ncbi:SDR family oxidoreductase [Variovorax sp. JS1663]|uniref:SDR family oxidoreductase n=1 Tax=Variovorax sp. JS1663 TaxID=1851577 RepID=UPI000B347100|nr:SDR family oxidoreductase [Variovorax sp. JS1663]OUM00626.1 NmrA family transcriptional regulator [Variovorax sp. JS1663]
MKVVIIGGSGLIGKKLSALLRPAGHEVMSASPSSGVNAVTGEGLDQALAGAQVVVDVTNSPSFEDKAVLQFFQASTRNLLAAVAKADVGHLVALSVVGADLHPDSGYLRAKVAQESLIKGGDVPYTILRATQFFEFLAPIADSGTRGSTVRVSSGMFQPVAAADVAAALADIVGQAPLNGFCELGGPERAPLDDLVRRVLQAKRDARTVEGDADEPYFGTRVSDDSLMAGEKARIGSTSLESWLAAQASAG